MFNKEITSFNRHRFYDDAERISVKLNKQLSLALNQEDAGDNIQARTHMANAIEIFEELNEILNSFREYLYGKK